MSTKDTNNSLKFTWVQFTPSKLQKNYIFVLVKLVFKAFFMFTVKVHL